MAILIYMGLALIAAVFFTGVANWIIRQEEQPKHDNIWQELIDEYEHKERRRK